MQQLELRWLPSTVQFSSSTYSVNEYTSSVNITVTLDEAPPDTVTVDYATSNGTATAGSDYTSASGTLTFLITDPLSKTFSVSITNDLVVEGDETVTLTLSNAINASLGTPSEATLTIVDNDLSGLTTYTVPTSNSGPLNLTLGPDNLIWFTENNGGINKIAKVTTSGTFTEYSLNSGHTLPFDIVAGPDGNVWFTESNGSAGAVAKSTTGGSITDYDLPSGAGTPMYISSTLGSDGALWFTMPIVNKIGKLTTSGSFSSYTIPTGSANPRDITLGPDGNLWFTELSANKIGRITPSGSFTEWTTPSAGGPLRITVGPDGNIWFTENGANKIGRISSDGNGLFTEWSIPTATSPEGITAGPDDNIWFVAATDTLGRLTPEGTFTEYALPSGSGPKDIVVGADNQLWITLNGSNKIGKFAWGVAGDPRTADEQDADGPSFGVTDGGEVEAGGFESSGDSVYVGEIQASGQTGSLSIEHSFDVGQSPATSPSFPPGPDSGGEGGGQRVG